MVHLKGIFKMKREKVVHWKREGKTKKVKMKEKEI